MEPAHLMVIYTIDYGMDADHTFFTILILALSRIYSQLQIKYVKRGKQSRGFELSGGAFRVISLMTS